MMKAVLLATLCILAVLSSINQALPQETRPEMVFVQGEEKYPARVEQGRIAVILAEKVASDEGSRRVTVESLRAAPIAGLPDNIVSVPVEGTNDANALTEMARRLRSGRGSEIAASGVIVFIGTSDSPIVITDQIVVQVESDGKNRGRYRRQIQRDGRCHESFRQKPVRHRTAARQQGSDSRRLQCDQRDPRHPLRPSEFLSGGRATAGAFATNDLLFASQWHLDNTGQNGGTRRCRHRRRSRLVIHPRLRLDRHRVIDQVSTSAIRIYSPTC